MKNILSIIMCVPFFALAQQPKTAADVVELIKQNVTCDWATETVDVFKAGNPDSKLTGIAVCMFPDMQTLQKAVENNCNFVITHEPIFYSHLDQIDELENDPVFQEKMKFINDNKLVVFRFHDHIHRTEPDGIYVGMLKKLGWGKYAVNGSQLYFEIPQTSLKDFSEELKQKLGMESIRVIGNAEMEFSKVGLSVGAPGGSKHIKMLQNPAVEVLVAGEAPEWETYSYANDAVTQGRKKAVIFLGHIKSEEAGMEYCAEWLQGFVSGIPILFIENESNFSAL